MTRPRPIYKHPRCGATNTTDPDAVWVLCHYCGDYFVVTGLQPIAHVFRLRA